MEKKKAIEYFGTQAKLARALGIKRQAVWQWGEFVPPLRAYQIQVITNGKLKVKQ